MGVEDASSGSIPQQSGEGFSPSIRDRMPVELPKPRESVCLSIISNSRLLHEGIAILLSPYLNFRVIGNYHAEPVAVDPLLNLGGQVILVDSGIGRPLVMAWTKYWRSLIPPAYVLILELSDDVELILTCIEAGANGYVLQGASPEELARAIHLVRDGKAECSPKVIARLFARLAKLKHEANQAIKVISPLTPREMEVIQCIAKGYSNKAIAVELNIELHTVKHHVHSILEKLQLKHRWDAARVAEEQGWMDSSA